MLRAALGAARARGAACAWIAAPAPDWGAAHDARFAAADDVDRLGAAD
ncbi:MAG: hypothetical protein M5U08_06825 [Burkholderiales bacterium]|nr:hypothetical protein [Burkholderiales bacterium]